MLKFLISVLKVNTSTARVSYFMVISHIFSDVSKIQEGIGDKLGAFCQWMSTCVSGIIIAFVYGWKLSLVCLSFSPVIAVCGAVMMKVSLHFRLTVFESVNTLVIYFKLQSYSFPLIYFTFLK